jgi:hypothetical protein
MPDAAKHSEQEQRNDEVYRQVFRQDDVTYSDWAVTAIFSRALHTVDGFLASEPMPIHPGCHAERVAALARLNRKKAASYYQMLKALSDQAMYECAAFSEAELEKYEQIATVDLPSALG